MSDSHIGRHTIFRLMVVSNYPTGLTLKRTPVQAGQIRAPIRQHSYLVVLVAARLLYCMIVPAICVLSPIVESPQTSHIPLLNACGSRLADNCVLALQTQWGTVKFSASRVL